MRVEKDLCSSQRYWQILADDLIPCIFGQGRCVLMPRYLRPLAPPPTILNKQEPGQQQAEAVAWSGFRINKSKTDVAS